MPMHGQMARRALEIFDQPMEEVIPNLMRELKTPYLVATQLGVYATAVRYWLLQNGWEYSRAEKRWIEPTKEAAIE